MKDVIVIGGGPGGSTAATLLARKGFSVTLLERERFPRFQIGESLLPYNNDLFKRLGVTEQLSSREFHPKYGAEFLTGDGEISCTFRFDRNLAEQYHSSFQVERAEFDHLLLRNAATQGVEVREETGVATIDLSDTNRAIVKCTNGEQLEARFVVDASGHGSVVGKQVGQKADVEGLKKIAIFSHYRNVLRADGRDAGNTVIVVLRDAWFWLIPITTETMSVGLVVDRDHLKSCGLTAEELLAKTIAETPHVARVMKDAERTTQVYVRKDFSFLMKRVVGENFALVGDAAGFLDPIFSTGVFMAMQSADIAANAIEARLRGGSMRLLKRYESQLQTALGKYFRFITGFYRPEFLEVFMQPNPNSRLVKVIVGVLAGNVFATRSDRLGLAMFFFLVRVQKWRALIAPRIAWERLPRAASV
jgi:flavin-dependent dehydrogenase